MPRDHAPTLDLILDRVGVHAPDLVDADRYGWQASTALLLVDEGGGPEALFIERAHRPGDRWGGQMALPGGKREPEDRDLERTATRETLEEVGVTLGAPVGRLDDTRERFSRGFVATYVYTLSERPPLTVDPAEVATGVWIPVAHLLHPDNVVRYRYRGMGPFAGVQYDRHTVWGLTLGIVQSFADVIGHPLPRPSWTLG
jgi:8-oxo-dGTP pyrophosphatase MutT (NUDIX family)